MRNALTTKAGPGSFGETPQEEAIETLREQAGRGRLRRRRLQTPAEAHLEARADELDARIVERAEATYADLEQRLVELAARIAGEAASDARAAAHEGLIDELAAEAQNRLRAVLASELESLRATLTETVHARVSADLELRASELEEELTAAAHEVHDAAQKRFNETAESISEGIHSAGLSQERLEKVRESTRAAEQRLQELRERISAADALLEKHPG